MILKELINLHKIGVMKVTKDDNGQVLVGGTSITSDECRIILSKIGWVRYNTSPFEILNKTDKFISSISKYLKDEYIINNTVVALENTRKTGTMSYFDRIKMICNNRFDITLLRGMGGVGGTYGIYSSTNNFTKPVYSCRSLKQVAEWIQKQYS